MASAAASTNPSTINNEFLPRIDVFQSFGHWLTANSSRLLSLEFELLSRNISFFPTNPDANDNRVATLIDVPVNKKGDYIHELFIDNDKSVGYDDPKAKHILIVHGFGASLGFFFKNFEAMSNMKNAKLHFIDLLGFGSSSRPKFPKFSSKDSKAQDLKKVENFFIDAIEAWRINRHLDGEFVLIGHSLGGLISFLYSLKYPEHLAKLILVSPVGVERSETSAKLNLVNSYIESQIQSEFQMGNLKNSELLKSSDMTKEIAGEVTTVSEDSINTDTHLDSKNEAVNDLSSGEQPKAGPSIPKLVEFFWSRHLIAPLSPVRFAGPFGSKFVSNWSRRRFSGNLNSVDEYILLHKYVYYSVVGLKKSGESCITRLLAPVTMAYFPMFDRIPDSVDDITTNKFHEYHYNDSRPTTILKNVPSLWMYGDVDWMNKSAGKALSAKINKLHNDIYNNDEKYSQYVVVPNAGHHVYLDNPEGFQDEIMNFLGEWLD